ncbi:MAG: hypothetical protein GY839_20485 [candidate division Zixibacteria bacterium]|nr:hypothetical protein [candidate division Zixibacteria bacterium]
MAKYLVLSALILGLGCAPQTPRPELGAEAILNLQVLEILGPSIDNDRPLYLPHSLAINRLKEFYIADYGNDRVVKLDSNFSFVKEVGGFGTGEYALNGPSDLALDKISNVYVIDSGNRRVTRYDRHLNFISSDDSFSKDEEIKFIRPTGIDISDRGDIFLGDEGLGACYKLDQFFFYIYEFGSKSDIQPVYTPADIAYGSDNKIYVADSEYSRVFVYDDFGLLIQTIGEDILQKPSAVAVSKTSGIWVTDEETGVLHCFSYRGDEIFRWSGHGSQRLLAPTGLFVDSDDVIYIVDSTASRIFVTRPIIRK